MLKLFHFYSKICQTTYKTSPTISIRNTWGNSNLPNIRGSFRPNNHKNPLFKSGRAIKFIKIRLPDADKNRNDEVVTSSKTRDYFKLHGGNPLYNYQEKSMYVSSTGSVIDSHMPSFDSNTISENFQKTSSLFKLKKRGKSYIALRKIRQFDEDFEIKNFLEEAQVIYLKVNNLLQENNLDELRYNVTEKYYPEISQYSDLKTIKWSFIKSLEPASIIQIRTQDVLMKNNTFAQIIVRFNSQQILAIFDKHGKQIYGSENTLKNVLEYVIFEKHLANIYGKWRIHAKLLQKAANIKETYIL